MPFYQILKNTLDVLQFLYFDLKLSKINNFSIVCQPSLALYVMKYKGTILSQFNANLLNTYDVLSIGQGSKIKLYLRH